MRMKISSIFYAGKNCGHILEEHCLELTMYESTKNEAWQKLQPICIRITEQHDNRQRCLRLAVDRPLRSAPTLGTKQCCRFYVLLSHVKCERLLSQTFKITFEDRTGKSTWTGSGLTLTYCWMQVAGM